MLQSRRVIAAGLACIALWARSVQPAVASHVDTFAKTDQKCRDSIAKAFTKAVVSGAKVAASCHNGRDGGSISAATDCNDIAQADTADKFQKMQQKIVDTVATFCIDAGASSTLLEEFTSCPEPCGTTTGVSNPLTSFAELGTCLACLAGSLAGQRGAAMQGLPAVPLSKEERKCHGAIAKAYNKRLNTALKARNKCQTGEDTVGNTTLSPCTTADPTGKINTAASSATATIDSSCGGVDLTTLDSCSAASLGALKTCLLAEDNLSIEDAFTSSYDLPPTICPAAVTIKTHAGVGSACTTNADCSVGTCDGTLNRCVTATRLEAGWNGIGHGQDLVDDFHYGVGLDCPNSSPPCGACAVTGYAESVEQPGAFLRCRENPRLACSAIGTDPSCPGGQECSFFVGPPLPLSASNTPLCVLVRTEGNATGSIDVESGELAIESVLRAVAHTGLPQTQPCPLCSGDTTPQDGERDGVCVGGPNNGLSCDVQGFDATFGNTSMDCVPATNTNVTGAGLLLHPTFTTGTQSMPFGTACDFPLNSESCACAVCSNEPGKPCSSDSDCTLPGTCSSTGGGTSRAPNACAGLVCSDVGGELGECLGGPDVRYCDGALRANGKGFLACDTNADCIVLNSVCPNNDCGTCSITETRSCFLDPIVSAGTADPKKPAIGSVFCIPPSSASGVNAATGLPGPSRSRVQVELGLTY